MSRPVVSELAAGYDHILDAGRLLFVCEASKGRRRLAFRLCLIHAAIPPGTLAFRSTV